MDSDRHQEIARSLFRESNDALFLFDPRDDQLIDVNPAAQRLTGFERKPLLSLRVWDILSCDDDERRAQVEAAVRKTGFFHSREGYRLRRASGESIPVNLSVSRIHTKPQALGLIVARDVSERVRATAALRESESRYRSLIEASGFIVATIGADGRIASLNRAFEGLAGESAKDWVVRPFVELLAPADRPRWAEAMAHAAKGRPIGQLEVATVVPADAPRRIEILSLQPFNTRDTHGMLVIARDVTSLHRATEAIHESTELRRAKEAAELANRAKSTFVAALGHEIRSPLTTILGYVDLLLAQRGHEVVGDDLWRSLEIVQQNGRYLNRLVGDLLDLARVEIGQLRVNRESVAPARLVDEAVSALRVRADEKGLSLVVEYATPIPASIATDGVRVAQILRNLLTNAVQYTSQGEIRVRVAYTPDDGRLEFAVVDQGPGLTDEDRTRLFEPFHRGSATTGPDTPRHGLGLALSRRLAQALGGALGVVSELGVGSTFSLTLPCGRVEPDSLVTPTLSTRPSSARTSTVKLSGKVLLAEDNEAIRRVMRILLEHVGVEVVEASHGAAAVECVEAARLSDAPFDLILMDMEMPVLDGFEATRRLRESGVTAPIVALTAHARHEDRLECLSVGCNDHLPKPVVAEDFLALLRTYLATNPAPATG